MLKELKYFFFILIIFIFIFFNGIYYFSDQNKKYIYRSINKMDQNIEKLSENLHILKGDTNIQYLQENNMFQEQSRQVKNKSRFPNTHQGLFKTQSILLNPEVTGCPIARHCIGANLKEPNICELGCIPISK